MSKDRFAVLVSLGDDRLGHIQRHDQDPIGLNGTCENLDTVSAITNLLPRSLHSLGGRFDIGDFDVIRFEEAPGVNGSSAFSPERLTGGENPWPFYFAEFYAA